MEFVERECGFIVAMAREIVDNRKSEKANRPFGKEELTKAAIDNGLLETE